MKRTQMEFGESQYMILTTIDESNYYIITITDKQHRPLKWWDNEGNHEEFRYEIFRYNKKGEPEWQSVVINSNIKLVLNEQKFNGDHVAYERALENLKC